MPDTFIYSEPPVPGMHSGLSLFGTSEILVDFQRGYHEEIFTANSADGPVLEFDFQGAKTDIGGTVIDLVNLFLKLEVKMKFVGRGDDDDVTDKKPVFVNNLMHSLFQNVEVSLNGTPVSSANNLYPYKTLVEAELSHNASCKEGWLRCQGYSFETNPGDISGVEAFSNRKKLGENLTSKWSLYGRIADNFLADNHKFLLPGVEVRIRLHRAPDQFVLVHEGGAKDSAGDFSLQIVSASLLVHKLELKIETFLTIERMLSKKAAHYDFREMVPKSFLISSGVTMYYRDDLFNRAPISRLVLFLVPETSFSGNFETNPFHFQQMDLETVRINREGALVGATPLHLNDNLVRSYYNTLKALGFEHGGNGITLDNFNNHFCLVFKLTADYHIEDNTIRPELTGARLGPELKFSKATTKPIRLILMGERRSIVLIDRNREVIKNSSIYNG